LSRNGAEIEVAVGSKGVAFKGSTFQIPAEKLSDEEREKYLLEWTTARCGDDGVSFTFDEGWDMIKRFCLDALNEMMKQFLSKDDLNNRKERQEDFSRKPTRSVLTLSCYIIQETTWKEVLVISLYYILPDGQHQFNQRRAILRQDLHLHLSVCHFFHGAGNRRRGRSLRVYHRLAVLQDHDEVDLAPVHAPGDERDQAEQTFTAVALVNFHEHCNTSVFSYMICFNNIWAVW
jgi:hypothetical protein